MPDLKSLGEIAEQQGVATHQVRYVIRSRGIQPTTRAAGIRLFGLQAQRKIATELESIREREKQAT